MWPDGRKLTSTQGSDSRLNRAELQDTPQQAVACCFQRCQCRMSMKAPCRWGARMAPSSNLSAGFSGACSALRVMCGLCALTGLHRPCSWRHSKLQSHWAASGELSIKMLMLLHWPAPRWDGSQGSTCMVWSDLAVQMRAIVNWKTVSRCLSPFTSG